MGELKAFSVYPETIFYLAVPLIPLVPLVWTAQRARGWPVKVALGLLLLFVTVRIVRIAAFFLATEDEWVLVWLVIFAGRECVAVLIFLMAWLASTYLKPKART